MSNTSNPPPSQQPARQRILLTAHDLFYRDGIRATGVDKIIAASAVAKVTFYRHFPSKNELILAFLDYRHRLWLDWFNDALKRHGAAEHGLAVLPEVLREWFANPRFRGCAFINCLAELGESLPEASDACRRHKQELTETLVQLLPPSANRRQLAEAAAIAVDGAIVKAQAQLNDQGREAGLDPLTSLQLLLDALATHSKTHP